MNKIKTFFTTLVKSCGQPAYYQQVAKAKLSFSIKYFLIFNLLISLLVGARSLKPLANFNLAEAIKSIGELYPQELVISMSADGLEINQPTPYPVRLDPQVMMGIFGGKLGDYTVESQDLNLITFESDENFSGVQDFANYNSLAVVTNSALYILKDADTGEIRAVPFELEEVEGTWVLDSQTVNRFINQVVTHRFIKDKLYLYLIFGLVIFLLFPGMLIIRAWTLMIYGLIVWALTSMMMPEKKLTYLKIIQLGMHGLTPVILLAIGLNVLFAYSLTGWLYFGAFLIWMLAGLSQVQPSKTKSRQ